MIQAEPGGKSRQGGIMSDLISRSDLLKAVDKIIDGCASYKAWAIRNAIDEAPSIREENNEQETDRCETQSHSKV